jgi:dephospho-CoA kinase
MQSKKIIGLIGKPGVGKDTIADIIVQKYGGEKFSFSRILIDEYCTRLGISPTHQNLQYIGDAIRPEWLHRRTEEYIANSQSSIIIIPSVRRQADFDFIQSFTNHLLISVETNEKLAFERMKKRKEKPGEEFLTWEAYQKLLSAPIDQEIPELQALARHKVNNRGSLEELKKQIVNILGK